MGEYREPKDSLWTRFVSFLNQPTARMQSTAYSKAQAVFLQVRG